VREPAEGQQVVHAQGVERDRPGDDELVVALVVRKSRGSKGLRREQLGIRVGDPAGRVLERLGVDIAAQRAQEVASRAPHCPVVNAASFGAGRHRLGHSKRGDALIFQGHAGFAPRARRFLPRALDLER
jgi:hypothetical protein